MESIISKSTQWLEENEKPENKLDLDKVILPTDTWSAQCMNEVSSAAATTDTLLQLDQYLEDELISLEQYLKQIGKLAREQFHKLALRKEIKRLQSQKHERKTNDNVQQTKICVVCGSMALLRCAQCKQTFYCSTEHQVKDWNERHLTECKPVLAQNYIN